MAEENVNEEIRVGVYVCHCGVNVGGVVNCPEVAEYAKTLHQRTQLKQNRSSSMFSKTSRTYLQKMCRRSWIKQVLI